MPDFVVDLPDRTNLVEQLQKQLHQCTKTSSKLALLVVDIPQLRLINTNYGYTVGDAIILKCFYRIQSVLRSTDTVTRVGGNEYVLILPNITSAGHAQLAISKILKSLSEPIVFDQHTIMPKPVVGVAFFPKHTNDPETLMQFADIALSHAKNAGERYALFNSEIVDNTNKSAALEGKLQQALKNSLLELHYQPQYNLNKKCLFGIEALLRWHDEEFGNINPELIISMAEKTNLIMDLTRWTLHTALKDFTELSEKWALTSVSVNLSASVLNQTEIVDLVKSAVGIWSTEASQLCLEITESAMMADPESCFINLTHLRNFGVSISIDDFGTGYSSLAYLTKLPAKELKIDKSFVLGMLNNTGDAKIVRAVIDLAHQLNLIVVAEGVENKKTLESLQLMGCDYIQGYFISKALPKEEFITWLRITQWR